MPQYDRKQESALISTPTEKVAESELRDGDHKYQPFTSVTPSLNLAMSIFYALSLRSVVRYIVRGAIPSFLSRRSSADNYKPETLHPTAFLDGLRGLAAFAVFLCHLSYTVFVITIGYGEGDRGDNNNLLQLPFIRLMYSGPPMVAIFFIISGYALSLKPIKQMRSHSFEGLLTTMSSTAFRRGLRLYLPCFCSTFIVLVLVRLGLYELTRPVYENKTLLRNADEAHVGRRDTFWEQLSHWLWQMWDFVHPWDWFIFGGTTEYDRHLWTIPVEFRASMVLCLSHLGLAKVQPNVRMCSFVALAVSALRWDRWEMVLFWAGAFFAEVDVAKAARTARKSEIPFSNGVPSSPFRTSTQSITATTSRMWSAFWLANFIVALYLCSYPDERGDNTPGFMTLAKCIPQWYTEKHRFWQSVGATQLVWAVLNAKFLQNLFTGPVVQYLGKISYAMYLMHGPVTHTIGWGLMGMFWHILGSDSRIKWEAGFALAAIFTTFAVVWAADIFHRAVDVPSVKFARWLESKCTITENESR